MDMCSISKVHDLISNWLAPHQYNIEYLTTFEFKGRCAYNFQTEKIFLIGKAAYQIPPYAAQSLNSGIRILTLIELLKYIVMNDLQYYYIE